MIHEYFIEPSLIYKWAVNHKEARFFMDSIGVGNPRLMSVFPESKPNRLASALLSNIPSEMPEIARTRVDEFAQALKSESIRRRVEKGLPATWSEAAVVQCQVSAPDVILSEVKGKDWACWISENQAYMKGSLFDHPNQLCPDRTAEGLTNAIRNLLRYSKKVIVADPYLYRRAGIETVVSFIQAALEGRVDGSGVSFQLIFDESKSRPEYIIGQIQEALDEVAVTIEVLAVREKDKGEKLHNRYVLSELGGVSFGVGTDAGQEYHSDDVFLLGRELYEKRMAQYLDAMAFDVTESEKIG